MKPLTPAEYASCGSWRILECGPSRDSCCKFILIVLPFPQWEALIVGSVEGSEWYKVATPLQGTER